MLTTPSVPLPVDVLRPEVERERPRRPLVILATNVAETSVTVPGITAVVDSGLARQRVHRARRSVLTTVAISAAAADQRRGRAGRLALIGALPRHWPDAAYVRRRKGDAWGNGEEEVVLGRESLVEPEVEAAIMWG